jgi:hypothetical protein
VWCLVNNGFQKTQIAANVHIYICIRAIKISGSFIRLFFNYLNNPPVNRRLAGLYQPFVGLRKMPASEKASVDA